jgi:FkbM family methyltransferase
MEANLIARLWRFPHKPWEEQRRSLLHRIHRWMPGVAVPIKLPFGTWWLAQHEYSTDLILNSGYEKAETAFVQRILREGMTVLDIGANRGYYTMLASRRVGNRGRVIAFEPSPRDRRFLRANLLMSRCRNVSVEPVALGSQSGETELYVVQGYSTGCNCLRAPNLPHPVRKVRVSISTLDECLESRDIRQADFVKIDVEGSELEIMKGAQKLLTRRPRPIILCELIEQLTQRWAYQASDMVHYLERLGFCWFGLIDDGGLGSMPDKGFAEDGNYVAVPEEKLASLQREGIA